MVGPDKYGRLQEGLGKKRALVGAMSVAMTISMALPVYSTGVASADVAETQVSAAAAQTFTVDEQIHFVRKLLEKDTGAITAKEMLLPVIAELEFSEQGMKDLSPDCLAAFNEEHRIEVKRLQKLLGADAAAGETSPAPIDPITAPGEGVQNAKPTQASSSEEAEAPGVASPEEITAAIPEATAQPLDPASQYPQWSYTGDRSMPVHQNVDLNQRTFVALYGEHARAIAQEHGLYASVMLAQAMLESNSGNSELASAPNNNLFRLRALEGTDSVIMKAKQSTANGAVYETDVAFAVFDTAYDSMEDYAKLMTERSFNLYHGALKSEAADCYSACDWLQGRYASDENYADQLKAIIKAHGLEKYDEPLDYELVDEFVFPVLDENGKQVIDPETMTPVMESRNLLDLEEVLAAQLGDPYVWGATGPDYFDCSGLVQYSYKNSLGVLVPRTTFFQCLVGEDVNFADLHTGDLLFFTNSLGICSHVGVYIGEGCFIEAPHTGDVVKVSTMEEKMPAFAKRILKTKPVEKQAVATEQADAEAEEDALLAPKLPLLKDMGLSMENSSKKLPPLPLTLPSTR